MKVVVDRNEVEATHSEKLLGLIVNCEMTWKDYLYGENWRLKITFLDYYHNSHRELEC